MRNLFLLAVFSLFLTAHSLAVEQKSSSCSSSGVAVISQQVSDPHYFCAWYLSDGRTRSPLKGIQANALISACRCVASVEPAGTHARLLQSIAKAARLSTSVDPRCSPPNPISKQFKDPKSFCSFFASFQRHDSPIPNINVSSVRQACQCITNGVASSSGRPSIQSKTSIKASSSKTLTKASSSKNLINSSSSKTMTRVSTTRTSTSTNSASKKSSLFVSSSKPSTPKALSSKFSSTVAKSSQPSTTILSESRSGLPLTSSTDRLSSTSVELSSSAAITPPSQPLSGPISNLNITQPTSLDSLALSFYTKITSGITYNSQGTIMGRLKQATFTSSLPAVTADPMDLSAQPSLQSQLQSAGLPSFNQTVSEIMAAMDNALSANVSSDDTSDFGIWNDSDSSSDPTLPELSRARLTKRFSFGDFLKGVDTYACNDFVKGLCEYVEDACNVKEGIEATYCLATGCYKASAPPVEYPFDNTYRLSLPSFHGGGHVYQDATSTLVCNDCGMDISKLRLKGSIVVDLLSTSIVSSTMTLEQSSTQRFNMNLYTTDAASGSWSYVMNTYSLQSITASNVFTITPQLLYAMGATWSTNEATSFSFGATSTLNGASVKFDPVNSIQQETSSWEPVLDITQPKLSGSSATLTPWIQSSVQISFQILGRSMPNAVTVNSRTSLGFTNAYVTMAKLGHTQCLGGQLQSTSYRNIVNQIVFANGRSGTMYQSTGSTSPVCQNGQSVLPSKPQVSALKAVPGSGQFCSSFIGYVPPIVNATIMQSLTQATSTISVVGTGTTTVTPSTVTTTITVTSSVSSIAQNMKRAVTATESSPHVERNALVARKVVPTPNLLSTWVPQQVSAACSSLATGVTQANVTSTRIVSSGVSTATIQGTVTAPTPMTTVTSVTYVPAVAPYDALDRKWIVNLGNSPSEWTFSGASKEYRGVLDEPQIYRAQLLGTGSFTIVLTGLEPGWTYNFKVFAGFLSTTDTCTVSYTLDDLPFESYSPTNSGSKISVDRTVHPVLTADGPYQVVPTAGTQTLGISMNCEAAGGFAEFWAVSFWGPFVS